MERDSITIKTADTIIHMKNNKEVARRMSSQEKSDFSLQHYLSMENPIQVTLLDSAFRASLYEHAIPAQTVTCYTFIDKTECSSSDTSLSIFYTIKRNCFWSESGDRFASVCSISFPLYSR